ncbi:MAG: hypothetical protein Q9181_005986 [Wetmoreana brouardii]
MAPYLGSDESGDEYGNVEDDDLLLAESAASNPRATSIPKRKQPKDLFDDTSSKRIRTSDDPTALVLAKRILKNTWRFADFRLKQQVVITRLIQGDSAVVIFPTGGGKSLVYQVPALAFNDYDELCGRSAGGGVTLVVSPLIALMKDQVDALRKRGVAAAALDSTQNRESYLDTQKKLRSGDLKLLYVAPEKLNNEGFIEMINAIKIRLLAIDEAHCISQWGHAFRPDYLKIARFAKEIRAERVLCLTATIVATIAFGMGIDKPDIRNVIHYAIPKSLEGYSQEIGRAGRDGFSSMCMIYLCADDFALMEQWCHADVPSFRSIQGLVGEILETHQYAKPGEVIERNLNDESKDWDIKKSTLDNLNAQLELRFELFRSITPKFSNYKYVKLASFERAASDGSEATKALRAVSTTAKKWTNVDVDSAATIGGFPRGHAVSKLQEWHNCGAIELQPSGVVNRFRILKEFPNNEKARNSIIDDLYERVKERERDEMARISQVVDLITARSCLSRGLAKHFGDEDSVPKAGCGHCSFCETKQPVPFSQDDRRNRRGRIDDRKFQAILAATSIRDDPRFLARVSFGIGSPRVTAQKLGKHSVFGSMEDCDFGELVQRFEEVCKS